jgi:hypothetical protein
VSLPPSEFRNWAEPTHLPLLLLFLGHPITLDTNTHVNTTTSSKAVAPRVDNRNRCISICARDADQLWVLDTIKANHSDSPPHQLLGSIHAFNNGTAQGIRTHTFPPSIAAIQGSRGNSQE